MQPQRFFGVSNVENPVPDPKNPDLPPETPSPEYAPGTTPEEFPSEPPATGDPPTTAGRETSGAAISTFEGEQ
jgi:hypothetical protein